MVESSYPQGEPCYVVEEAKLEGNLVTIAELAQAAGVEFIVAFKAFALWRTFGMFRRHGFASTASSLYEAELGYSELGRRVHAFSPVYRPSDREAWLARASHISFNSLSQYQRFGIDHAPEGVSFGLRINPEYSPVSTDLYNPALPGSRFGVTAQAIGDRLPKGIEGLHFHVLCEGDSFQLERVLAIVDHKFGHLLQQAKWLNLGGGHLVTESSYNRQHLTEVLQSLRSRYPGLEIFLEPGSAFAWQTGYLEAHVEDIVSHAGITTAILDVSFTCHMPDCLEMPYQPRVRGAEIGALTGKAVYRLGGCSCLSGDYIGDYSFEEPLTIGQTIIFEDMIHYTTVKTNMFNGVAHPSIVLEHTDGSRETLRRFTYEDYKHRMN